MIKRINPESHRIYKNLGKPKEPQSAPFDSIPKE
jgi:hypothetical protein